MRPSQIRPDDLAEAMGMSVDRLWAMARNIDVCYRTRRMQWDGKKHRPIDPLYKRPKKLLRRLHGFLQRNRLRHPAAHGGISGRSCFTSARLHLGARNVWTRDASNCYPSISPQAMHKELRALGFRADTARLLIYIFTYRGGVPQGSPVSGDALNLFFWRLDQLLSSIAGSHGLRYGRIADDFVLSGNDRDAGEALAQLLEGELAARGVSVNEKKKRVSGLQTSSDERLVHSISVARRRGTKISRSHTQAAIKLAENYVAASRSVTADSIQAVACKRHAVAGWMYYCRQADFGPAKTIRNLLEAGDRHVLRRLRAVGLNSKGNKWWVVNHRAKRNEPKRLSIIWSHILERAAHCGVENDLAAASVGRRSCA